MAMLTVKLRGVQERILNQMVEAGIAETKSEALRIALLNFGLQTGLLEEKALARLVRESLASDARKPEQVAKAIKRVKHASVPR